jgi:hypothetical protein
VITDMSTWNSVFYIILESNILSVQTTDSNKSSYPNYVNTLRFNGIATNYGLDGPGSNPGGDEIFRPSRPALGPTQPPVKRVPGIPWGKVRPERAADHSPPSSAAVMEE